MNINADKYHKKSYSSNFGSGNSGGLRGGIYRSSITNTRFISLNRDSCKCGIVSLGMGATKVSIRSGCTLSGIFLSGRVCPNEELQKRGNNKNKINRFLMDVIYTFCSCSFFFTITLTRYTRNTLMHDMPTMTNPRML